MKESKPVKIHIDTYDKLTEYCACGLPKVFIASLAIDEFIHQHPDFMDIFKSRD